MSVDVPIPHLALACITAPTEQVYLIGKDFVALGAGCDVGIANRIILMLRKYPCLCALRVLQVAAGEGNLLAFGYRERLGYISRLYYFFFLLVLHGADRQTVVAVVAVPVHLLMVKGYNPDVVRVVFKKR